MVWLLIAIKSTISIKPAFWGKFKLQIRLNFLKVEAVKNKDVTGEMLMSFF